MNRCAKSLREQHKYWYQHDGRDHPSFSSTLLDAIYRSFDESTGEEISARDVEEEVVFFQGTPQKKHNNMMKCSSTCLEREKTRVRLVDQWMEKAESEKILVRRRTLAADLDGKLRYGDRHWLGFKLNPPSCSSDSISGGEFTSSDYESLQANSLKLIRTNVSVRPQRIKKLADYYDNSRKSCPSAQQTKEESRAMKIYGDLKKAKQPMSPGGRLSSFLNSLFHGGGSKKPKISRSMDRRDVTKYGKESKSTYSSTCSTASSFSRSCMSKTPSSAGSDGKFNNIDDEERDIGDGDGDGSTSCCSSDLFELDNALEIGVGRYTEELPVYETTRPHTNRAIANGLIV
ncbi:hypothetical protein Nepgr_005631 [Nepenthes gracilis]|uniref:Uncharacterized protein n=1 Tax=Nepenthes gracilis TaxID=150966 RepID=A0AAD3XGM1_NEPGR|nr:hypothetical protein Nepgr_005631 [Nepenthes gracilis]